MVIRGIGLLQTLDDIAQVVVVNLNGTTPVRVRDLGRVEIGHQERTGIVGFNTEDDVSVGIVVMTKGGDAVKVIEGVKQRIDELNQVFLPAGTRVEVVNDRTKLVTHTIHTVTDNLLHGALLVVIILMVFLIYRHA